MALPLSQLFDYPFDYAQGKAQDKPRERERVPEARRLEMLSSHEQLLTMVSQGWEIEPPVYIRPRWRSRSRSEKENAYHFVLWNGDKVNLVSVHDCPEIQQFLVDNGLAIDRL